MTETTLLVLVVLFLFGCFGVVYYYDKKLVKAITAPQGMVLVTGPTGSGKTTTLYSILKKCLHIFYVV